MIMEPALEFTHFAVISKIKPKRQTSIVRLSRGSCLKFQKICFGSHQNASARLPLPLPPLRGVYERACSACKKSCSPLAVTFVAVCFLFNRDTTTTISHKDGEGTCAHLPSPNACCDILNPFHCRSLSPAAPSCRTSKMRTALQ